MTTDKKKTAQEDFIEQVKKLGIPVNLMGIEQLAHRRQMTVEAIIEELEKRAQRPPEED